MLKKGKGKPARRWQVFLQDLDRKNLIASAERPAAGAGLQGQRPCLPSHTGISEHGKDSKRSLKAAGFFSLDTRYPKTKVAGFEVAGLPVCRFAGLPGCRVAGSGCQGPAGAVRERSLSDY